MPANKTPAAAKPAKAAKAAKPATKAAKASSDAKAETAADHTIGAGAAPAAVDPAARIAALGDLLKSYKDAYYNGQPLVSDAAFDQLEDELRALDPRTRCWLAWARPCLPRPSRGRRAPR
jgi:hypothetical protein